MKLITHITVIIEYSCRLHRFGNNLFCQRLLWFLWAEVKRSQATLTFYLILKDPNQESVKQQRHLQ